MRKRDRIPGGGGFFEGVGTERRRVKGRRRRGSCPNRRQVFRGRGKSEQDGVPATIPVRRILRIREVEGARDPKYYVDIGVHCTGGSKSDTRFYTVILTRRLL